MSPRINQRGTTSILFSLVMMVLFGLLGLVVDVGWSYFRKGAAQTAAQAAAIAAVAAAVETSGTAISCGDHNVVCQAETACPETNTGIYNTDKGCLYAQENGFQASGRQSVTVEAGTSPPPNAPGTSPKYWVSVKVSERIPQLFSAIFGNTVANVSARATVGYFPPITGGCIYVLNPTDSATMLMNGNILFQTGCGANINSNSPSALKMVGSAVLNATSDSKINIVGGYDLTTGAMVTPTPVTGAPRFSDPMGDVPPPPSDGCDSTGVSIGNNEKLTITPGIYCGPLTVTGHAVLTMSPGLYVIKTGGLSVGGQASLNGNGVTIYVQSGSVGLAGGASTNLYAPTSGAWQGILFYQDRSNLSSASLVGGSNQLMNGVLYFPTTHVDYTAGSTTTAQSATIICDTLNIVGNSYLAASGNSPFLTLFSGIGVLE